MRNTAGLVLCFVVGVIIGMVAPVHIELDEWAHNYMSELTSRYIDSEVRVTPLPEVISVGTDEDFPQVAPKEIVEELQMKGPGCG